MLGRIPFPVMTDAILFRSSLFRAGRTFPQYISHVAMAALTPDVRSVARGLRGAHHFPFKFQNYLAADDLIRLMKVSNLSSEFGQSAFCFFCFLFLLRAPSDALWMRRADFPDR